MQTRNTIQLQIVRDTLNVLANHPTAEEVYEQARLVYPSMSKATVYRGLNKLVAQGAARKLTAAEGPDRFDHQVHPHAHVQCEECGCIQDIPLDQAQQLIAAAQKQSGYRIDAVGVLFVGLCPQCVDASGNTE